MRARFSWGLAKASPGKFFLPTSWEATARKGEFCGAVRRRSRYSLTPGGVNVYIGGFTLKQLTCKWSLGMNASRKKLGLWMTTALVVGNVIGSGIFMLPASLAPFGTLGLGSWIVTGLGAILLALVFSRLSSKFPRVGGPYAFSRYAFGDFVGFQVAWGYWLAVWISTAALVIAAVSYASVIFPLLAQKPHLGTWTAIGIVWFFTLVNAFGAHTAGSFQIIMTLIKLVPIALIGILGWFFITPAHYFPLNPTDMSVFGALSQATTLTLFAFIGIESATVPAEDIDKPQVTIARATTLGTIICAALYVLATGAVMGIVPAEVLIKSEAPFVEAVQRMVSPAYAGWVNYFIVASALISCLGATNGWVLLQAQVPYAAAKDKLFPAIFARVSEKNVPLFGLFFSSILMTGFMLLTMKSTLVEQFNTIAVISVFTILVSYVYSSLSELVLIFKGQIQAGKKQMISSVLVAGGAFAYALWAIAGSGDTVVYWGALFLLASIPVYVGVKWKLTNQSKH